MPRDARDLAAEDNAKFTSCIIGTKKFKMNTRRRIIMINWTRTMSIAAIVAAVIIYSMNMYAMLVTGQWLVAILYTLGVVITLPIGFRMGYFW
jgi:hypothetical protein